MNAQELEAIRLMLMSWSLRATDEAFASHDAMFDTISLKLQDAAEEIGACQNYWHGEYERENREASG